MPLGAPMRNKAFPTREGEQTMTDCLMYWRYFWEDIAKFPNVLKSEWYTKSEHFFKQVDLGNSLWVIVSDGSQSSKEWRLLQRIVVAELTVEDEERPFHATGDLKQSEMYDIKAQSDFATVLHQLEFVSGKKIRLYGRMIGRTIQAIRPLSDSDIELLEKYSRSLKRL
jgi:hypothetical protein